MPDLPLEASAEFRVDLARGHGQHHRLVAINGDGRSAVGAQVTISRPADGGQWTASFACAYLRVDALPIVLVEDDIVAPDRLWELRASGLWVDTVCEEPFVHWSYGLEAFGLAVDDGDELLGRGYGQRVPLGWELDFVSGPEFVGPFEPAGTEPSGGTTGYRQLGAVEGIVLLANGSEPISGPALRHHWFSDGTATDGAAIDGRVSPTQQPTGSQRAATEPDSQTADSLATDWETAGSEVALPSPDWVWRLGVSRGGIVSRTEFR